MTLQRKLRFLSGGFLLMFAGTFLYAWTSTDSNMVQTTDTNQSSRITISQMPVKQLENNTTFIKGDTLVVFPDSNNEQVPQANQNSMAIILSITAFTILSLSMFFYRKKHYMQNSLKQLEKENMILRHKSDQHKKEADTHQQEMFNKYMAETNVYRQIKSLLADHKDGINNQELLSAIQWEEIYQTIDFGSNGFTTKLVKKYPALKTEDIHFCCLLKMGLKYTEIACLLGRTTNMMYKRRNLIAKRMDLEGNVSLDKYIESF